jgi:hypothetical protein
VAAHATTFFPDGYTSAVWGSYFVVTPLVVLLLGHYDLSRARSTEENPWWAIGVLVVGGLYPAITFFWVRANVPGVPETFAGQFVLNSHGALRHLTEAEYQRDVVLEHRSSSAGLLYATLLPALYFWLVRNHGVKKPQASGQTDTEK